MNVLMCKQPASVGLSIGNGLMLPGLTTLLSCLQALQGGTMQKQSTKLRACGCGVTGGGPPL